MSDLKMVMAAVEVSYTCDCPHCTETISRVYLDDWDIGENIHYGIEIVCP